MNAIINQDIIEKVQKLLALGQSPNEHEAQRAIEHAQRLLLKYNLTMNDVKVIADDVKELIVESGKRASTWKQHLLNTVAHFNYGELLIYSGGGMYRYAVIAKEVNFIVIKNMYEYLIEAIDRMAKEYHGKGIREKNSYRMGLVQGLHERFIDLEFERKKSGMTFEDGTQITALMVIDQDKREHQLIKNYMDEKVKGLRTKKTTSKISAGSYGAGKKDAGKINLNAQIS